MSNTPKSNSASSITRASRTLRPHDEERRLIFSAPELLDIRQALEQTVYVVTGRAQSIWFDGYWMDKHIEMELRFHDDEQDKTLTLNAAMEASEKDPEAFLEERALLMEFIGSMFERWLNDTRYRSPDLDWQEYEYSGRKVLFRGTLLNEDLEAQADAFLKQHGINPSELDQEVDDE